MPYLPLDIAPDLRLTIGNSSVKVTPRLGMRLAESLLRASTVQMVRQAAAKEMARPKAPAARKTARR